MESGQSKETAQANKLSILRAWGLAMRDARFRIMVLITTVGGFLTVPLKSAFLRSNELREGVTLADPLLDMIGPHDVTWITFTMLYTAVLLGGYELLRRPYRFLIGAQAYFLIMLVRIVTLWLVPLDPPAATIPLIDPVVDFFVESDTVLMRDLFFSGHTYTAFLVFLMTSTPWRKAAIGIMTALVGVLVIVQHVHYSIDVLAALFFCFGCLHMIRNLNARFCPEIHKTPGCDSV